MASELKDIIKQEPIFIEALAEVAKCHPEDVVEHFNMASPHAIEEFIENYGPSDG